MATAVQLDHFEDGCAGTRYREWYELRVEAFRNV